jgi:urease beta subunit
MKQQELKENKKRTIRTGSYQHLVNNERSLRFDVLSLDHGVWQIVFEFGNG